MGFGNLGQSWLETRKLEVKCYRNLRYHIHQAILYFGNRNIKTIHFAELEDFYRSLPARLSAKTKKNYFTTLHSFWTDIVDREEDSGHPLKMPKFPKIKYELRRRKTITRDQQLKILAWLKQNAPFKVWLGIKWLSTYISIRPGELVNIKEGEIDRNQGVLNVKDNKSKSYKIVPLLGEDSDIILAQTVALPHIYFFRHSTAAHNNQFDYKGRRFGKDYFYTWWRRSCRAIGLSGVDLYGGTRHSTAQYLRLQGRTPEEIKRATMHSTTEAFNRYFEMELEDLRAIYGTGQVVKLGKDEGKVGE